MEVLQWSDGFFKVQFQCLALLQDFVGALVHLRATPVVGPADISICHYLHLEVLKFFECRHITWVLSYTMQP